MMESTSTERKSLELKLKLNTQNEEFGGDGAGSLSSPSPPLNTLLCEEQEKQNYCSSSSSSSSSLCSISPEAPDNSNDNKNNSCAAASAAAKSCSCGRTRSCCKSSSSSSNSSVTSCSNSNSSSSSSSSINMCRNCLKVSSHWLAIKKNKLLSCHRKSDSGEEEISNREFGCGRVVVGEVDDTYPAVLVNSAEDCGRYLVASRDIPAGEIILREKPLVIGPMMECISPLCPTCLGCCRITNTAYVCSKCKWPVCNETCEKIPDHADFECKIFRKQKIPSLPQPQRYQFIQYLRCCLLKDVYPEKFAQLVNLESHVEDRRGISSEKIESRVAAHAFRFINEICRLHDYDMETIDYIVGVSWINSFGGDALEYYRKRRCSMVFHKLSMLNHDCIPNTRLVIQESKRNRGRNFTMLAELRASVFIPKGTPITQQYINVIQGTMERRSALQENWYFSCRCARCSDASELGTYFSAVKCQECSEGFLLPLNPLNESCPWKCDNVNCCENIEPQAYVQDIAVAVSKDTLSCRDNIEQLEELLWRNNGITLHPNHWLILDIEYQIVEEFINTFGRFSNSSSSGGGGGGFSRLELALKGVSYSSDLLQVADVISPGQTTYRGVLIYFMYFCISSILSDTANLSKPKDDKFTAEFDLVQHFRKKEDLLKEGREILMTESDGSPYRNMANKLLALFPQVDFDS